jgi:hypothetical protein
LASTFHEAAQRDSRKVAREKPIADALRSHRIHASRVESGCDSHRGSMSDENDFDLRPDQWEALKALRSPSAGLPASIRWSFDSLVALGLATMDDRVPAITDKGRKALVRGSFSLLDAAA